MIDITNVSYLSFRMAPFILVCFFILQSILNYDLKGIIYLAGLMFASVATVLLNNSMLHNFPIENAFNYGGKCSIITLGEGGKRLTEIPLSIAVYSYTFFYMLIFIFNLGNSTDNKGVLGSSFNKNGELNAAFQQNIPTLILFPLLCFLEVMWSIQNNCVQKPLIYITAALIIGAIVGVVWAIIITSLKINSIMYLSKSGVDVCSRPSKTYFSCKKQIGSAKESKQIVQQK
jgi:hypothetical protein